MVWTLYYIVVSEKKVFKEKGRRTQGSTKGKKGERDHITGRGIHVRSLNERERRTEEQGGEGEGRGRIREGKEKGKERRP